MAERVKPLPAIYANDPDDTVGRALYRAKADQLAREQLAYEKRAIRLLRNKEADNGSPSFTDTGERDD